VLCKNKYFEKLVHLVGFTVGIYYDERTYELQRATVYSFYDMDVLTIYGTKTA
jgi:hypothetical protein